MKKLTIFLMISTCFLLTSCEKTISDSPMSLETEYNSLPDPIKLSHVRDDKLNFFVKNDSSDYRVSNLYWNEIYIGDISYKDCFVLVLGDICCVGQYHGSRLPPYFMTVYYKDDVQSLALDGRVIMGIKINGPLIIIKTADDKEYLQNQVVYHDTGETKEYKATYFCYSVKTKQLTE